MIQKNLALNNLQDLIQPIDQPFKFIPVKLHLKNDLATHPAGTHTHTHDIYIYIYISCRTASTDILDLSRHFSQSFIDPGRSSGLHPVSSNMLGSIGVHHL